MPAFFEGFGGPAWDPDAEHSGTTLEQPLPQPVSGGFAGKVVVVTGGATGLGRCIAMEFARQRCKVAFCFVELPGRDVTPQALLTETACTAMGGEVFAARCDVRDRASGRVPANRGRAQRGVWGRQPPEITGVSPLLIAPWGRSLAA